MNTKSTLRRAMQDSDDWVIEMDYIDAKGNASHRTISPIRFVGGDRLLALCLCREAPRQFQLARCQNVRLLPAAEVLMPMPMPTVGVPTESVSPEPVVVTAEATLGQPCLA